MKKTGILKKIALLGFSAAMIFGTGMVSQASTLTDAISSVELSFSYDLSSGMSTDDVSVTSSTDGIESITVSSISGTTYGTRPTVKLTIKADTSDGYYFDSDDASTLKTSSAFELDGDTATYSSSKRSSNSSLTLTVRLAKIDGTSTDDLSVDDVTWGDNNSGSVAWTAADDADTYNVKLLRGSTVKETFDTTNTSYDFSSYITSTGTYYVKVRAYNSGTYGEWTASDGFYVDSDILTTVESNASSSSSGSGNTAGEWKQNTDGTWYFLLSNGEKAVGWQTISNKWYCFDSTGFMYASKWIESTSETGTWYYLGENGNMLVSTTTPDGYTVDADGKWKK